MEALNFGGPRAMLKTHIFFYKRLSFAQGALS